MANKFLSLLHKYDHYNFTFTACFINHDISIVHICLSVMSDTLSNQRSFHFLNFYIKTLNIDIIKNRTNDCKQNKK